MIVTRFLRWCGFQVWTEAELIEELAKLPGEFTDMDEIIRKGK